jgi:hypothetical protein
VPSYVALVNEECFTRNPHLETRGVFRVWPSPLFQAPPLYAAPRHYGSRGGGTRLYIPLRPPPQLGGHSTLTPSSRSALCFISR